MEYIELENLAGAEISYPVSLTKLENLRLFGEKAAELILNKYQNERVVRMVGIGSSGIILMSMIAASYKGDNLKMVVMRKEGENSHGSKVEVDCSYSRKDPTIIVDDFASTGHTIRSLVKDIHRTMSREANIAGVILGTEFSPKGQLQTIWGCSEMPKSIEFIATLAKHKI